METIGIIAVYYSIFTYSILQRAYRDSIGAYWVYIGIMEKNM